MPPAKKKKPAPKKPVKKTRTSSVKKKRVTDKAWSTSIKVEIKGTPEDSRASTPACVDNDTKSRNSSMTSRDFIRQVLEFDRASESDLDSEEDEDDDHEDDEGGGRSSDAELKIAIKDSLAGINGSQIDSDMTSLDGSDLGEPVAARDNNSPVVPVLGADHDTDSNTSFSTSVTDGIFQSVYAPMPETIPTDMPQLTLPLSSDDLIIEKGYILRAAGVYEVLRVYSQILRLSPFIFEEFLAAIGGSDTFEYNPLLHEVHSCLIKTLLREEDNNQTSFGPVDLKDSMNSSLFFNDAMTYSHVIREYLRSDADKEFSTAFAIASESEYPNISLDKKITLLEILCNLFLASNSIREELSAGGFINYDDHCRSCQKYVQFP